jgi:hypothetical protein
LHYILQFISQKDEIKGFKN